MYFVSPFIRIYLLFIYYYYIIATETPEFPLLGNQDYLILKSHAIMN